MAVVRRKSAVAMVVGVLVLLGAPAAASAHPGHGDRDSDRTGGAVVTTATGPDGTPVLVLGGSGAGIYPAGSALYAATVDPLVRHDDEPYRPGCDATTQAVSVLEESHDPALPPGGPFPPFTCAGAVDDPTADWPALTTDGPPVAGPGVDAELLGSVYRSDLGARQVTYGGHPLYLFDPGPGSFAGQDFFETSPPLFPWHTAWYLVSPLGIVEPGVAGLVVQPPQPGTDYTSPVLSVTMLPAVGGVPVTVYTLDDAEHDGCGHDCAGRIAPVLTAGAPMAGPGVDAGAIGTITRDNGTMQVTYHGEPLYMFMSEVAFLGTTGPATTGNGAGATVHDRALELISP